MKTSRSPGCSAYRTDAPLASRALLELTPVCLPWRRGRYAEILARKLPRTEQDEELRAFMDKTLHTVQAAIAKGKL